MTRCYTAEELRAYLADPADEPPGSVLSEHLEGCPHCQQVMERLSDSPDLRDWVGASGPIAGDDGPGAGIDELIARLCELPPGGLDPPDERPSFVGPPAHRGDLGSFGTYRVLSILGRGATGVVFKAFDPEFARLVALKVVRPEHADDLSRARFARGARHAAGVRHESVARVHSVRIARDRSLYLVMEYVGGTSLRERIRAEGHLPPREAARAALEVAEGLAAVHGAGLVHRDVKPANIILQAAGGRAKLVDFDLARDPGNSARVTREGDIAGTAEYMSPEQVLHPDRLDGLSDVYSLGATLYEALTGRVPFSGTPPMVLKRLLEEDPPPPRKLDRSIPRDLQTICLSCLHKDPRRRYAGAGALAEDLRRFLAGEPIRATATSRWEIGWRWVRRHPLSVVGAAALAAFVLGGVTLWHNRSLEAVNRRLERANQRLEETGRKLAVAVEREEQAGYRYRIGLAHSEWLENNVGRAAELLDECPEALRSWEWSYLRGLSNAGSMTLTGHPSGMAAVAFSPDGTSLAASGAGGTLRLWDAQDGRPLRSFSGFTRSVRSIAFGPGNRLAAGGQDGTIRVWDLATGKVTFLREGAHPKTVGSVAFSPDGRRLASAGGEPIPRIWDLETGRESLALSGSDGTLAQVAFSPDGKHLAAASYYGSVRLWDLATGKESRVFSQVGNSVNGIAFHPDGRSIASGANDGTVTIWDTASGRVCRTLRGHAGQVSSVAFSPDGKHLASAGMDQAVLVWNTEDDESPKTLRGHTGAIWSVAFGPDGRRLASTGWDGMVRVWDPDADQGSRLLSGPRGMVFAVAVHPDGRRIACAGRDRLVRIIDGTTGRGLVSLGKHSRTIHAIAFSPDGRHLASGGEDGVAWLWDPDGGRALRSLNVRDDVNGLAFSPDSRHLASASPDRRLRIWDVSTGRLLRTLKSPGAPAYQCVAYSPDGRYLVAAGAGKANRILLWDMTRDGPLLSVAGHDSATMSVAFSPDGRRFASAGNDHRVKVWDAREGREVLTYRGHTHSVSGVGYTRDGRRLVSAGWDRTVRIWDSESGQDLLALRGHSSFIHALAIGLGADGERVVTGDRDAAVRIWTARW